MSAIYQTGQDWFTEVNSMQFLTAGSFQSSREINGYITLQAECDRCYDQGTKRYDDCAKRKRKWLLPTRAVQEVCIWSKHWYLMNVPQILSECVRVPGSHHVPSWCPQVSCIIVSPKGFPDFSIKFISAFFTEVCLSPFCRADSTEFCHCFARSLWLLKDYQQNI